jgi:hypothetical protein
MRVQKNGQVKANLPGPDSAVFYRYHSLTDGFIDKEQRLIAIGNTNDYDTTIYSSTYYRAFAARFNEDGHNTNTTAGVIVENTVTERAPMQAQLQFYPNPVRQQMTVTNLDPALYDELLVYDLQGKVLIRQKVTASAVRVDLNPFMDGVYLLVLRSSTTRTERSGKFLVRK